MSVGGLVSGVSSSFQSPVCSAVPSGVRITTADGSGIECDMLISSTSNGPIVRRPPSGMTCNGKPSIRPSLGEFRFQHLGGERRGIDRDAAELRPEIDHRAEMILMRVGEQQAVDVVALVLEEADVGQDDVDAGLGVAAEGDAHVDDQPLARAAAAIAVEIQIHADLAHAAQRQEDEIGSLSIRSARHVGVFAPHRLKKNTSPAEMRCSPPSGVSSRNAPSASNPA